MIPAVPPNLFTRRQRKFLNKWLEALQPYLNPHCVPPLNMIVEPDGIYWIFDASAGLDSPLLMNDPIILTPVPLPTAIDVSPSETWLTFQDTLGAPAITITTKDINGTFSTITIGIGPVLVLPTFVLPPTTRPVTPVIGQWGAILIGGLYQPAYYDGYRWVTLDCCTDCSTTLTPATEAVDGGNWISPITGFVRVQAWGGGGSGGSGSGAGGGGGSGGYGEWANFAVVKGNTYTYHVSSGGVAVTNHDGNSAASATSWNGQSMASGGKKGIGTGAAGTAGVGDPSSIPLDVKWNGAAGAAGSGSGGGGGGGAPSATAAGVAAIGTAGGIGAGANGGAGVNGGGPAGTGGAPGAGGGGNTAAAASGAGADGQIILTCCEPCCPPRPPPTVTQTSNVNNYPIVAPYELWDVTSTINLTGLVAPLPGVGNTFTFINTGTDTITVKDHTTSSTGNQITTPGGTDYPVPPGTSATFTYDPTTGYYILVTPPPPSGGASGTGTVTTLPKVTNATGPVYGDSSVTDASGTVTFNGGVINLKSSNPATTPGQVKLWGGTVGVYFPVTLSAPTPAQSGGGITEAYSMFLPPTSAITSGVGLGVLADSGDGTGSLVWLDAINFISANAANVFTLEQTINPTTATTNAAQEVLSLWETCSGTPAAGFGVSVGLYGQISASKEQFGQISAYAHTAIGTGNWTSYLSLYAYYNGGAKEAIRIGGGASPTIGVLGKVATPAVAQTGDAGTALVTFGWMTGTPTFAVANLTGAGTGVLTALGNAVGAAGGPLVGGGTGSVASMTGYPLASVVGAAVAVAARVVDVSNSGTSETDMNQDTVVGGTLAATNDRIDAQYAGTFALSATDTREMRLYFAGTAIFDSGALAAIAAESWIIDASFYRVSSSVIRYCVKMSVGKLAVGPSVGELTGLTLASNAVVKITGQATGAGGGITCKVNYLRYSPSGS